MARSEEIDGDVSNPTGAFRADSYGRRCLQKTAYSTEKMTDLAELILCQPRVRLEQGLARLLEKYG